ncbi:MAG: HAD family phosphatase [Spirochaetaceae bacterium]
MAIHIFDVDHTLIRQSTGRCFLKEALSHKIITIPQIITFPFKYILYKLSLLDPDFIKIEVMKLKNIKLDFLRELSMLTFNRQTKSQIYTDAIKLVALLKKDGHRVIAATSSVDFLIEPVLNYLGIDEFVSSRMEIKDGVTTGHLVGEPAFGEDKKIAVESFFKQENLSFEDAVFYSDSYNDLPLLDLCSKAIPVNPDKKLYKEAVKRGWECLFFKAVLQ